MKPKSVRLMGLAWPLLLPLMTFELSEVPAWFSGTEGRALISQLFAQLLEGVVGALIEVFTYALFNAPLPAV